MLEDIDKSQLDRIVGSGVQRTPAEIEAGADDEPIVHTATGHATGGGLELIYADGATGAVSICQRPRGSSGRGQELSSHTLDSSNVDDGGDAHQYIPVPHRDFCELVAYVTCNVAMQVIWESDA